MGLVIETMIVNYMAWPSWRLESADLTITDVSIATIGI